MKLESAIKMMVVSPVTNALLSSGKFINGLSLKEGKEGTMSQWVLCENELSKEVEDLKEAYEKDQQSKKRV